MGLRPSNRVLLAGAAVAAASAYWLTKPRDHSALSLEAMLAKLDALDPDTLTSTSAWSAGRIFDHLAQSVEFSMDGYPQPMPEAFQHTLGKLSYRVFQARSKMTHRLEAMIPGEVPNHVDAATGLARLKAALRRFADFEDPLQPHHVYGPLSHADYALAHAMHIESHLTAFAGEEAPDAEIIAEPA